MCASHDTTTASDITEHVADAAAPTHTADPQLISDLVVANHILFDQGVVDGFGHVSVRHDARADRFLLSRNMAPGTVTANDILEYDLDSAPVNARGAKVYAERFIHGEIYRAHPDVMSVIHSHSHAIVPLTTVKSVPLRAIFHMAGFIGTAAPVFEIRDVAGPGSDLLIRDRRLGAALAQCFKSSAIVLMRGHGSTVVAPTLQRAVYRAVYAELNARYQTAAMGLGEVTYLTEEEARTCASNIESHVQRPWDLWKAQAQERRRHDQKSYAAPHV
jgi:ribulose-5-phosphate 4-epimerase/fuculose-1-phosphate aldolase